MSLIIFWDSELFGFVDYGVEICGLYLDWSLILRWQSSSPKLSTSWPYVSHSLDPYPSPITPHERPLDYTSSCIYLWWRLTRLGNLLSTYSCMKWFDMYECSLPYYHERERITFIPLWWVLRIHLSLFISICYDYIMMAYVP